MHIPIPNGQAEICARDLASDCRTLAKNALRLKDAVEQGTASKTEHEDYTLLVRQIESLSQLVCIDPETMEEFRVGDYVTVQREILANVRKVSLRNAYKRLQKWLH